MTEREEFVEAVKGMLSHIDKFAEENPDAVNHDKYCDWRRKALGTILKEEVTHKPASRAAKLLAQMAGISPERLGIIYRDRVVEFQEGYPHLNKLSVTCQHCHHRGHVDLKELCERGKDRMAVGCSNCGEILQRLTFFDKYF